MKKAQLAVEHILVVTFGLLIITSTLFFILRETEVQKQEFEAAQLKKFGNAIIEAVNTVAYSDFPSKITFELAMPSNVDDVLVENNRILVFNFSDDRGSSQMVFSADIDIVIEMNNTSQGIKRIVVESKGDFVSICDQYSDRKCNKICDWPEENNDNSPADCCLSDCTGCVDKGSYYFCTNDSICHTNCYRHNNCNQICP